MLPLEEASLLNDRSFTPNFSRCNKSLADTFNWRGIVKADCLIAIGARDGFSAPHSVCLLNEVLGAVRTLHLELADC
jgi:hypothetical protein